jgi:hypothetical protein
MFSNNYNEVRISLKKAEVYLDQLKSFRQTILKLKTSPYQIQIVKVCTHYYDEVVIYVHSRSDIYEYSLEDIKAMKKEELSNLFGGILTVTEKNKSVSAICKLNGNSLSLPTPKSETKCLIY